MERQKKKPTELTVTQKDKSTYFTRLALELRGVLKTHKNEGLWGRNAEGKRDWGNVSEHCLVVAARVAVMGKKLGLSPDLIDDLKKAAILHDLFKKSEKKHVTENGLNWKAFDESNAFAKEALQLMGYSDRVVYLAGAAGHGALKEIQELTSKETLSAEEKAFLILHYVDDYTMGANWVAPAELNKGRYTNDLKRRVDSNRMNPRYQQLDLDGKQHLDGETTFDAQERIGKQLQKILASLLVASGEHISKNALLPQHVDKYIKAEILQRKRRVRS